MVQDIANSSQREKRPLPYFDEEMQVQCITKTKVIKIELDEIPVKMEGDGGDGGGTIVSTS